MLKVYWKCLKFCFHCHRSGGEGISCLVTQLFCVFVLCFVFSVLGMLDIKYIFFLLYYVCVPWYPLENKTLHLKGLSTNKLKLKSVDGATFLSTFNMNGTSLSDSHTVNLAKPSFMIYYPPLYPSACLSPRCSFHLFFSSSVLPPLLFGLCACGHQGNSSNLPTHVPVGQWAIRGQSTSLSSCHKWCWRDREGPRLCFEGQQGRSPALCQ